MKTSIIIVSCFNSAGIDPEEVREREDLLRIPSTTKKQLQSLPIEKITAKNLNLRECTKLNTSGSTGIPLGILLGKEDLRFRGAVLSRAFRAHGGRPGDKVVQITSNPSSHQRHWYENLGIRRWYGISPFSEIDDQIDQLKRRRPDILIGFPSSLQAIAKAVKEKGVEGISPRATFCGAEILTPATRGFLNTTLRTTTIDLYNSVEFGSIAWECKVQAGYHINVDVLIVEVIQDGKESIARSQRGYRHHGLERLRHAADSIPPWRYRRPERPELPLRPGLPSARKHRRQGE